MRKFALGDDSASFGLFGAWTRQPVSDNTWSAHTTELNNMKCSINRLACSYSQLLPLHTSEVYPIV